MNPGTKQGVASISVKRDYERVYLGTHFEGQVTATPRLHHGAWICEVFVSERSRNVVFRLGHLDKLEVDGVDLLRQAQASGWSTAVATNAREVALWCARECAAEILQSAAESGGRGPNEAPAGPRQKDWETLQVHLGGPPDALEQALFEREFVRTLRNPAG
jgi:hypothetical protein